MTLRLISPALEWKKAFLTMYEDFARGGEKEWCLRNDDARKDFAAFVARLKDEAKGAGMKGWVPTSNFWLVQDDAILGTLRLRHYLTPAIREEKGHIAYDIAPGLRGKGLGNDLFRLGLIEADRLSLGDVLAHSLDTNHAAQKILTRNGGKAVRHKKGETWYMIKGRVGHPVIREARLEDAAGVARVHVVSWQTSYKGIVPEAYLKQLSIEKRTEDWRNWLRFSERRTFVLEVDVAIYGWATVGLSGVDDGRKTMGELFGIYLDPGSWSKQMGAHLYARAETGLRALGFTVACLWVLEENARGRRFYERMGFRPNGKTKGVELGGAALVELGYRKAL